MNVDNIILDNIDASQALRQISPGSLSKVRPSLVLDALPSLPLAGSRLGNLFHDRFNANLIWYMPQYTLPPDPDFGFSFLASQSIDVDNTGNHFNKGTLTTGLKKIIPDDVQNFQMGNPTLEVREIPLLNITASLSITFIDSTSGQPAHNNYTGEIIVTSDGDFQLVFDNIIAASVIILYENLQNGGATITISSNYNAWLQILFRPIIRPFPGPRPPFPKPVTTDAATSSLDSGSDSGIHPVVPPVVVVHPVPPIVVVHPDPPPIVVVHPEPPPVVVVHPVPPVVVIHPLPPDPIVHPEPPPVVVVHPLPTPIVHPLPIPDPGSRGIFRIGLVSVSFPLPLEKRYAVNDYSLKFIISDGSTNRPIINADDLRNYNLRQSEFEEVKVLGDISLKYPSLRRIYAGVLSKTVVVIPASYSIVRTVHGLSAICRSALDSGGASGCEFEFAFSLAPDVSMIDLFQLSRDISAVQELDGYIITLPNFLKEEIPPKLSSLFQSSAQYFNTSDLHTFALNIYVKDQDDTAPAIVTANLFLKQLCQENEPYLLATLSLKLDDYYSQPVETNAVLNFHKSTGTDDLTFSIDNESQKINFLNSSPFELLINRYALCSGKDVSIVSPGLTVKSGKTVSVPLNLPADQLNVLTDRDINSRGTITKENINKFIAFETEDVQSTQFTFGVNASAIDFDTPGISQIDIQVTLPGLPDISVPQFSLVKLHAVDRAIALVPIQNAITSLKADVLVTIHHIDSSIADVKVNVQHQFIDAPILVLQNRDISK